MMLSSQPTAHSIIHVPDEHLPGVFSEFYRVRNQIGSKINWRLRLFAPTRNSYGSPTMTGSNPPRRPISSRGRRERDSGEAQPSDYGFPTQEFSPLAPSSGQLITASVSIA